MPPKNNKTETDFFQSKEFKEKIEKSIQKETWDKGLPRYYNDKEGNIVEHWKDGTINIIKHAVKENS